jgi:hypothetical protein
MRSLGVVLALPAALLLAACQGRPASSNLDNAAEPWTAPAPPADVSHGEAAIGSGTAPAPVDPRAPQPAASRVVRVRFEVKQAHLAIAPGVVY